MPLCPCSLGDTRNRSQEPKQFLDPKKQSRLDSWLIKPQKHLHAWGLIMLMVAGSLIAPVSIDMYLPSIPGMTEYFGTSVFMVNLTLLCFTFFLAVGLLIFGAISDKFGRRPVLIVGMSLYALSGILCAMASTIELLIAARIVQALASGAVSAVCMAVVKDAVKAEHREKVLSVVQIMFVVGPVASPIFGAAIVQFFTWHAVFWTLFIVGLIGLVAAIAFEETLDDEHRTQGSPFAALGGLVRVGKNPAFMTFLIITSFFEVAFMSYISLSSYIYIGMFNTGEVAYSLYLAIAAVLITLGPIFWLCISKRTTPKRATTVAFLSAAVSGVIMFAVGHIHPLTFCLSFILFAFIEAVVRPYSINLLLSQSECDAGAASSLINFVRTLVGCLGMVVAVLPWSDYIDGIATIIVVSMVGCFIVWAWMLKSHMVLFGVKDAEEPETLL